MSTITGWGTAILTSLTNALALVFAFVPKFIGFLVILLIGWIVASAIAKAVTFLLRKIGFERFSERIGLHRMGQRMNIRMDAAHILGRIVYWFVFLIFLVPALDALGLTTISTLLNQVIDYIPNVFVALLVLFLGTLLAHFVGDIVRVAMESTSVGNPRIFANIARYAILGFAALIALEQLQIAQALLNILFTAIIGSVALAVGLAFGLSFGLGGRETAQNWLARGEAALNVGNIAEQATMRPNLAQPARPANQIPDEEKRPRRYTP